MMKITNLDIAPPPEVGPGYGYGGPDPMEIVPPPDYNPAPILSTYGAPDNYSPVKTTAAAVMDSGADPAPPGDGGPDPDELAMLGIDPEDSTV